MEGKRLYVGNLTYSVNESQLRDLFSQYGEIASIKVIEQKGFAFVEMETSEEAQAAMDALNQTVFEGRTLRIDEARPMQPRSNFGGGGSYGGGSSYGGGGNRRRYLSPFFSYPWTSSAQRVIQVLDPQALLILRRLLIFLRISDF